MGHKTQLQLIDKNYSIYDKWGESLGAGFVVIPSALLRYQAKLKIGDGELAVLMNLIMSWWRVDELPFPRTSTIATRMGVATRTVQRHLGRLEEKGFIRRIAVSDRQNGKSPGIRYDLKGTVEHLKRIEKTGGLV
jgi:predicted transcriptional regulator